MLLGFGVKLPTLPLHNWLPDAHVDAPTEGSIVLAGLQLKMGAYGLIAILLPTLPGTVQRFGWLVVALALGSLLYGALAALAQSDLKRLIAYTSVNHMGYVMLALAIAAMSADPAIRSLALTGAVVQMVSHGLLTGGLFLMVGVLQHRAGTRELARFGGLIDKMPAFTALLVVLAFGSFGLPGLSGFIAELQVIGAAVSFNLWAAIIVVLALVIMTAAYLRIASVVTGKPAADRPPLAPASVRELGLAGALTGISVLIGILPAALVAAISVTTRLLAKH
jgi:NADH-quinone oxidoreductase subunit M